MADESNALMRLPDGRTCGDCAHFPKCAQLVGAKERWVQCDWFPSRFRAREVASIAADRHAALLRLVTECRKQQRCYFQTRSRWALDAAKAAEKELDAFLEQTMPGGGRHKMSTFRPILFSDPMVRAILDGAKTQTRRISPRIAKWRVGDLLWVRETWATTEQAGDHPEDATVVYRATDPDWETMQGWRWRPSIFMPCWACRITLKITDLRMHRLQEISEEDAIAEGAMHWWRSLPQEKQLAAYAGGRGPVAAFRALWDEINEKSGFGWAVNPWVKAISFELIPARGLGPTPAGRAHLPGCTPRREMATR